MVIRFFSVSLNSGTALISLLALLLFISPPNRAGDETEAEADANEQVKYIEMRPSFVINYGGPANKLKFAKVDISLRVNTSSAEESVASHMPALRNEVVLLLSRQTDDAMDNTAGRELIRSKALESLNEVLQEETGAGGIGDLLFTTFVVQG